MADDVLTYFINLLIISVVMLPLYYFFNTPRYRQLVSIFIGAWALYAVAPEALLYWGVFWGIVWAMVWFGPRISEPRQKTQIFALCVIYVLLPMVTWKINPRWFGYQTAHWLNTAVAHVFPFMDDVQATGAFLIPVGLSFSTFRAIDLLINVNLDLVQKPKLMDVFHYGLFSPVLIMGPIIQYSELQSPTPSGKAAIAASLGAGGGRILIGITKLFFLVFPLASSPSKVLQFQHDPSMSQLALIGYTLVLAVYFYLNFSAYSDIAIGVARLYGHKLRENFHFPYFQSSLQAFWANWHMSLTSFAQRNVFIPLGGFRKKSQYRAVFLTMMVIALWHGLTLPMVVFGVAHGTALIVLRILGNLPVFQRRQERWFRVCSTILTFLFVAATIPLHIVSGDWLWPYYRLLFLGLAP